MSLIDCVVVAIELFEEQPTPSPQRRGGRRLPGALDPYAILRESGSHGLEAALKALDIDQLKDIVAEHGMDPARLVMKWRKTDRIVEHIISFVASRDRKGDVFRNPALVFRGATQREAEAARDDYFKAHPHELDRFDLDANLSIELQWDKE